MSTPFATLVARLSALCTAARPLTVARLLPTTIAMSSLRVRLIRARMGAL